MKNSRVCAFAVILLFIGSIVCWREALFEPRRLIFLPGGDVGLGFRSYAGRVEWIDYAPWDRKNMDYVWWSLPWWPVLVAEMFLLVLVIWLGRRRTTDDTSLIAPIEK